MTQIYCVKCRGFTDTKSEKFVTTSNGRTRLTGICKICDSKKGMFVSENKKFNKKDEDELEEAKFKRMNRNLKKKALAIGWKALLDEDTTKCVKACFPKTKKN
jgi:hypothetical protein